MHTPTTRRSTASAHHLLFQYFRSRCLRAEVALWMRSNRLQLITAKTEVLWCATSRRQYQIPQAPVRVGEDLITPAAPVRDSEHLSGFRHLHEVTRFEDCVELLCCSPTDPQHTQHTRQAVLSLVVSLVLSRLDYGSATLVGLPAYQIDRAAAVRVERRRSAGLLGTTM